MDLVAGAQAFQILARHLKDAGEGGLRRELNKGIRDAAKPAEQAVRSGLRDHMPNRYADELNADLQLSESTRLGGTETAGIHINAKAAPYSTHPSSHVRRTLTGRKLKHLEAGVLTHPLFGDREHWYSQPVEPRFFAGPISQSAPQMRDEVLAAMHRVADQVTRKV